MRPVIGEDELGAIYLGECRVHGWHGEHLCPKCLTKLTARSQRTMLRPGPPLNARYRPGDEIVAFGLARRRFWTDSTKPDREGHCRMCRRPAHVRQLTRHHLIPQEWWKQKGPEIAPLRNAAANIVPLCRPCHDDIEVERNVDSRRMLRRLLVQTEIAFMIDVIGRTWVDQRYPA